MEMDVLPQDFISRIFAGCLVLLRAAEGVIADIGPLIIHAGGHERRVRLRLNQAKARVLEEMRPEVEAGEDARFITTGDEGASQDEMVLTIKAGQGEVVVIRMDLKAGESAHVIFHPLPHVAKGVIKTGTKKKKKQDAVSYLVLSASVSSSSYLAGFMAFTGDSDP